MRYGWSFINNNGMDKVIMEAEQQCSESDVWTINAMRKGMESGGGKYCAYGCLNAVINAVNILLMVETHINEL